MNMGKKEKTIWKHLLTWVCLVGVGYWMYRYHLDHAMGILPYVILLYMYHRLGKKEEELMISEFGDQYLKYKKKVPAYVPKWETLFKSKGTEV